MSCIAAQTKSARLGALAALVFLSCLSSISIAKGLPKANDVETLQPFDSHSSVVTDQYEFSQYSSPIFVFPSAGDFDLTGYMKHLVSINTLYEDDFIHKVYGSTDLTAAISVPDGMYNDFIGGATAGSSSCYDPTWMYSNTYTHDSWVSIGLTCTPSFLAEESDVVIEESATNPWSADFDVETFFSGNAGPVDISMDDESSAGSWYLPSTDATNGFAGEDCKSVIMQITSEGSITWTLNAEIWVHGDENTKVILSQTFDGESMGSPIIEGCTDSNACNYYALATSDNGSCDFPDTYYDCDQECIADIDDDGLCDELELAGCQDSSACNYNENATDADVCVYAQGCETCTGESDGTGGINANDDDADGVCNDDEVVGCQETNACNYNALATDAGTCVFTDGICETCSGETDGSGSIVDNDSDNDGVCDSDEVVGCEDSAACNYNALATDDAACFYASGCDTCSGETDGTGVIVDGDADDDAVCDIDEIPGCQDDTACNYDASATTEGVECLFATGCDTCSGATDGSGTVMDNDADNDGVCDAAEVEGCQESSACNYNSAATDAGDCVYPAGPCDVCSGVTDGTGTIVDNDEDDDFVCDAEEVVGCQDESACNFNAAATDAGTCIFADGICDSCSGETDGTGVIVDNDEDNDGVCDDDELVGCQDSNACNYNAAATDSGECTLPDGICETCSGATDGTGTTVDNDSDNDGVCDGNEVVGCQDASACNYDASATDEGTCVFVEGVCETCSGETDGTGTVVDNDSDNDGVCDANEVVGCQDPLACNYNASATDAGISCAYAIGSCATCLGSPDDGTGTVASNDADGDGVCDAAEVPGCQNEFACNYDVAATDENGSCIYATGCESCSGASDGSGTILANDDDEDGVCNSDEVPGCQDEVACNFNSNATDPGVACIFPTGCESCSGATDGTGSVLDNDDDEDGVCNIDEVVGCTNPLACNYDVTATDEGDCYIAGEFYGCDGECLNDLDGNGVCDEIDALLSDADFLGYTEGIQAGLAQCVGEDYCGEGTVWVESLQMCVEDASCPGDLNGDQVVGTGDLLILLNHYGFACD